MFTFYIRIIFYLSKLAMVLYNIYDIDSTNSINCTNRINSRRLFFMIMIWIRLTYEVYQIDKIDFVYYICYNSIEFNIESSLT